MILLSRKRSACLDDGISENDTVLDSTFRNSLPGLAIDGDKQCELQIGAGFKRVERVSRARQLANELRSSIFSFKDGAYYCYCAYVLRISRYSDFLWPRLTNTGIFLRGLKLSGESRS